MGFGKKKRKIREAIAEWKCFGHFGYGQGRTVTEFGENELNGKSACLDICNRVAACRECHFKEMDNRYPQLAQLVGAAYRIAKARGLDTNTEVSRAMHQAVESALPDALAVQETLVALKVFKPPMPMVDHYRCGQFENIHDGINKKAPGARGAVTKAGDK